MLIKTVIKRDGIEVPFDVNRIITAIMKAQESCEVSDFKHRCIRSYTNKYIYPIFNLI